MSSRLSISKLIRMKGETKASSVCPGSFDFDQDRLDSGLHESSCGRPGSRGRLSPHE